MPLGGATALFTTLWKLCLAKREHSNNTRENTERTALKFEPLNWTLHHLTIGRLIAVQFNEDGSKQPDVEVEVEVEV